MTLVQKALLFNYITTVGVVLDTDASLSSVGQHPQGGVDFDFYTFLQDSHILSQRFISFTGLSPLPALAL
ncbi:MAG: hypothetical protein JXA46_03850 [Dehalococcoidales bacterium]|nr:hypothetical protein [Dehalococcoidales bacterium]